MARYWTLAAILIGCGCSEKSAPAPVAPPTPKPMSMFLFLMPGAYGPVSGKGETWQLSQQYGLPFLDGIDYSRDNPRPSRFGQKPDLTLSCAGANRVQFSWTDTHLLINTGTFPSPLFAQIPRTLLEGQTWDFVVPFGDNGQRRINASCKAEGHQLRVDFVSLGATVHSMWFTAVDGLIRWEGIAAEPIVRIASPLQFAALTYAVWGRVDDEIRQAIVLCSPPAEPPLRTSVSRDEATHGRKQYYLFAMDRQAYLHARDVDQPDGQIVIKESWYPKVKEGESWAKATKGPLFMMMKSGGEWIYATATADGRTFTGWGKLMACMECHESDRTRDRMFGLQSCAAAK